MTDQTPTTPNLRGADLQDSNLRRADLWRADLKPSRGEVREGHIAPGGPTSLSAPLPPSSLLS